MIEPVEPLKTLYIVLVMLLASSVATSSAHGMARKRQALAVDLSQVHACGPSLEKQICVTEVPEIAFFSEQGDENCRPNAAYAAMVQKTLARLPAFLQSQICSLKKIIIARNLMTSGQTELQLYKTGAFAITLNEPLFSAAPNMETFATWKEQLSFGGSRDAYAVQNHAGLPTIAIEPRADTDDPLLMILVHELGHVMDFRIQAATKQEPAYYEISWPGGALYDRRGDFPYRKNLCFYSCESQGGPLKLSDTDLAAIYAGFENTNFVSLYGARFGTEDFAEGFLYYVLHEYLHLRIVARVGEKSFDLTNHWYSKRLKEKRKFMGELFALLETNEPH